MKNWIKTKDLADKTGLTTRQIQRLAKKYNSDIEGHFVLSDTNGYLFDDYAVEELKKHMKIKEVIIYDSTKDDKIKELEIQLEEARNMILEKDRIITHNQVLITQHQDEKKLLELKENELKQTKEQLELEKKERASATERAETAETRRLEAVSRTTVLEQQLNAFNEAQALKEAETAELERKLKESEEARIKEREEWKNKSLFQRLFKK